MRSMPQTSSPDTSTVPDTLESDYPRMTWVPTEAITSPVSDFAFRVLAAIRSEDDPAVPGAIARLLDRSPADVFTAAHELRNAGLLR